ncbi:cytochrome c nitrite reductase small subunit [Halobacteriovorax sp.]|uniref:cytochrome c nitrite reductase small subunit n=1 Tax=Halobacteriovorax sp. TaxID=2020862 RepID=UPI003AF2B9AD
MKLASFIMLALVGAIIGLGTYTVKESNALSYMSDDPKACLNCHVMNTAYNSWKKDAHSRFTNCNSCHVPHENLLKTYGFKAMDGLKHSYVFTTRTEPQALRLSKGGQAVVQRNCIGCHGDYLMGHAGINLSVVDGQKNGDQKCWDCHQTTPHGKVHSLSADNQFIFHGEQKATHKWIKEYFNKKEELDEKK